jgi:hypothetical protein
VRCWLRASSFLSALDGSRGHGSPSSRADEANERNKSLLRYLVGRSRGAASIEQEHLTVRLPAACRSCREVTAEAKLPQKTALLAFRSAKQ